MPSARVFASHAAGSRRQSSSVFQLAIYGHAEDVLRECAGFFQLPATLLADELIDVARTQPDALIVGAAAV